MRVLSKMTQIAKRLTQTSALLIVAYGPLQLHADNCFTMLMPVFNNAKSPGNIPGQTYATVTKQHAGGNTQADPDLVRYAFGNIGHSIQWWNNSGWWDTVSGTITVRQNTTKNASMDMFAPSQSLLSLRLAINANGMVSVQELVGGNPIGGNPPTVRQGVCSSGLITFIDDNTSWVLTLTTFPPQWIK